MKEIKEIIEGQLGMLNLESTKGRRKSFRAAALFALVAMTSIFSNALSEPTKKSTNSTLSIQEFIDQVRQKNDTYRAALLSLQAAKLSSDEAGLALATNLFASGSQTSDAKPSPFFRYDHLAVGSYSVGIAKLFEMGLQTKVSYSFGDTEYVGFLGKYFEARPQFEATLPLWRNFMGRETSGNIKAGRLVARAKYEGSKAAAKSALLDAEMTYWRLSLSREALKVSRDAVERAQAIFSWTERRGKLNLSDRGENLQAMAQLKARRLDLIQAEDDERSARLAFNTARGISGDKVDDQLMSLNADLVANWKTPQRAQNRSDVEAARLQTQAAEASAQAASERTKPSIELFGLYALNSPLRDSQDSAFNDSLKGDKQSSTIGIRLNMPLDPSTTTDIQHGWIAEAAAARATEARKIFEQDRDWNEIISKFSLTKEKLRLFEDLEVTQRQKLENERLKQRSGRTTLAQVIQFEVEFEQTQLARLRTMSELLALNAQLNLYRATDEGENFGSL